MPSWSWAAERIAGAINAARGLAKWSDSPQVALPSPRHLKSDAEKTLVSASFFAK
jgi:hypothetical protein